MIGILILLISLVLYFKPRHRYISYFIYLGFMTGYQGGYGLLTDEVVGIKNMDLAIVYTFIINFYLLVNGKLIWPKLKFMKSFKIFTIFFIGSIFFSIIHYQFTSYQILQGGRTYILIFCIPILMQIKCDEIQKILKIWINLVTITCIIYIFQIILGRAILPFSGEARFDPSTGLIRLYNLPFGVSFFLSLTFLEKKYFKLNINIYRIIFFTAIMCTLGRTGIFTSILTVLLAIMFVKGATRMIKYSFLITILTLPFIGTISDRFAEGGTDNDINTILSGKFDETYETESDATMTYRIAWVYERASYLIERPLGEIIFGMGLISDSQPLVHQLYHFKVGLMNDLTGYVGQLQTPDNSYGNLICQLGFVGTIVYLWLIFEITSFFYKRRKIDPLFAASASVLILMFLVAFASSELSNIKTFAYLLLFMPLYKFNLTYKKNENNTHRIGLR